MTPLDWSQRFLESTRGRIVARLRRGSATVEQLAAEVALSENGVRLHLATLERDGWISAEGVRRGDGPGKPATLYALTPGAPGLLSTAYRPVLLALLAALRRRERPAHVAALLRETGRRLATEVAGAGSGRLEERATAMLKALGGDVEIERGRGGRFTLVGLGCPVGEAVAVEPSVCQALSALLADALDVRVESRCDRSGSPCCRFEVSPGEAA